MGALNGRVLPLEHVLPFKGTKVLSGRSPPPPILVALGLMPKPHFCGAGEEG